MNTFWFGFVAFPVVTAVVLVVWAFADDLLSKNTGMDCRVYGCDFKYEIGEKRKIALEVLWRIHKWNVRNEKNHVEFFAKFKEEK